MGNKGGRCTGISANPFCRRSMKLVFPIIVITFAVLNLILVQPLRAASNAFDGSWAVTLYAPEYKDPTGVVAHAFTFQFPAHVKDGVLHGEHGRRGQPAWLELDGKIDPDGSALLHANGITGQREYNIGHTEVGKPYAYDVKARFKEKQGTGERVGGRIEKLTFVKE